MTMSRHNDLITLPYNSHVPINRRHRLSRLWIRRRQLHQSTVRHQPSEIDPEPRDAAFVLRYPDRIDVDHHLTFKLLTAHQTLAQRNRRNDASCSCALPAELCMLTSDLHYPIVFRTDVAYRVSLPREANQKTSIRCVSFHVLIQALV